MKSILGGIDRWALELGRPGDGAEGGAGRDGAEGGVGMADVASLSAERRGLRQLSTNSALAARQTNGAEAGKRKKPKKDKKKVDDEITVNARRYVCVRVCARVCACVRGVCACVGACVRACVRARVCACVPRPPRSSCGTCSRPGSHVLLHGVVVR